ncbi:Uncharacterized protein DBV15_04156 [Temnothorax longispinosus]|uniref:Uncharacterized protein n=1 Tax=Temnothorax longispinosus TaxID=300112 RepID=A0A4S2KW78_9HYME|nr:Uncharacterized protein DBV15_04156 [Temnothorax longispinosus]
MFLVLFDVLQELLLFTDVDEKLSPSHQASAIGDSLIDINNNNNDFPTITTRDIKQCDFSAGTTNDLESDYCCMNCSLQSTASFSKNCDFTCKKKSATILTRDDGSSMKDTFDATSFPVTHEKYRKSSYRDISKDFCVSNYHNFS